MTSKYRIPIYTLKSSDHFYHLSSNPNYKFDPEFRQETQEFGTGLYTTPSHAVRFWQAVLRNDKKIKQYIIPVHTTGLKVIKEDEMPSRMSMAADLKAAGMTASRIIGSADKMTNTLGRDKLDVAIKRNWAKLLGVDGILPTVDRREAPQLIIINPNVKLGDPKRVSEFFRERNVL